MICGECIALYFYSSPSLICSKASHLKWYNIYPVRAFDIQRPVPLFLSKSSLCGLEGEKSSEELMLFDPVSASQQVTVPSSFSINHQKKSPKDETTKAAMGFFESFGVLLLVSKPN